jgi:hypothetical protein
MRCAYCEAEFTPKTDHGKILLGEVSGGGVAAGPGRPRGSAQELGARFGEGSGIDG